MRIKALKPEVYVCLLRYCYCFTKIGFASIIAEDSAVSSSVAVVFQVYNSLNKEGLQWADRLRAGSLGLPVSIILKSSNAPGYRAQCG